jgi:hypothetical protein
MDFNIIFETADRSKNLVEFIGAPGLDILDQMREENPDIRRLPAYNIHIYNTCPIEGNRAYLKISEDKAREIGLFKGHTVVTVVVPEYSFSKFITWGRKDKFETVIVSKNFITLVWRGREIGRKTEKRLTSVSFNQEISYNTVYDAWKAAGFPLVWVP